MSCQGQGKGSIVVSTTRGRIKTITAGIIEIEILGMKEEIMVAAIMRGCHIIFSLLMPFLAIVVLVGKSFPISTRHLSLELESDLPLDVERITVSMSLALLPLL